MDDRNHDDFEADAQEARAEASVLRSMLLLSTLSTAAEVWYATRERRAGRDPSGQEAVAVAAPFLREAREELQERVMRLRASLAYATYEHEAPRTALVRRFDDLMTLNRVARLLHLMHQRLLSLYPEVSEALVEEVRVLEAECSRLRTADEAELPDALALFLDRTLLFTASVQREVG